MTFPNIKTAADKLARLMLIMCFFCKVVTIQYEVSMQVRVLTAYAKQNLSF